MENVTPISLWIPAAIVVAGAVFGLLADALRHRAAGAGIIAVSLVAAFGVCGWTGLTLTPTPLLDVTFVSGGVLSVAASVVYLIAALSVLSGWRQVASTHRGVTMAAITAFSALGIHVLISSLDLLTTILVLETIAIAGYALVSGAGGRRADEAALRYFIQGGVATGFTLLGLAVLYGIFGSTNYLGLCNALDGGSRVAALGMVLILSAFAFKLGAAPFHTWAPDVYEVTEPATAAFLASAPKIGALMALLMVFPAGLFNAQRFPSGTTAIAVVAAASIVIGNLGGLRQSSLTRMLGYSGVAQVGYGLIGLASGVIGYEETAIFAVTYALGVAAAFFAVAAIRERRPQWDGSIAGLAGLAAEVPVLAVSMVVAVLSLTGIPLFLGFWGKLLVFTSAISAGLTWLAVAGVLGSVISFGYYGKVLIAMYAPGATVAGGLPEPSGRGGSSASVVAVISALLVVVGGVGPLITGISEVLRLFTL
ncbi:MAG: NADH-quinone oxidoreductase subunit N [Coriobacteriia bacterium]|nr:NADH-quinone oxidoreductase subunit N [Coriobacteriia bacterium]MBN2823120.1 NADH-quinone oxidoreductase subunit N [Coriobacteriia bacterium]